jgi:hypothetical protein
MLSLVEQLATVARLAPASQGAGAVNMTAIDLAVGRRFKFKVFTGVMGASGTVDFKVQWSNAAGGTYADVTGAALAQIVKATGDNKVAILEVDSGHVKSLHPTATHIRGVLTVGTAASLVALDVEAGHLRYGMAEEQDIADVVEIKQVVN